MFNTEEKVEVIEYLKNMEANSSVYIGCDSVRFKKVLSMVVKFSTSQK